jgi:hypothetical protein
MIEDEFVANFWETVQIKNLTQNTNIYETFLEPI